MIVQGALAAGAPCIREMMQSHKLSLRLSPEVLRQFLQLFGQGVGIKSGTGNRIKVGTAFSHVPQLF